MKAAEIEHEEQTVVDDGFANVIEAAGYLSMSRSSVYALMDNGALPYAKFGKARRIPWRALREYARRCLVG